jgi:serine/threonine-protein kinase
VRLGSLPANSDDDLRFVQDRIGLFAKTTFLIATMFLVVTWIADFAGHAPRYSSVARASHCVGTLIAFSAWRVTRMRQLFSAAALHRLDIAATLGTCWSFAAMGHYAVQPPGFYTALLAIIHVTMTRAIVVPSIPRRTLGLAVACFASLVVSRSMLPVPPDMIDAGLTRGRGVLEAVLWSTAASAVATFASVVIYGLQERAREARQLGQYTLEERIGEGGMGEVYRASHAMLRRPTAVKLLTGDGTEEQLRRFEKEVQLTSSLTHPNTISIYDYGRTPDGIFYYAMELLDGMTLEHLVDRHGPLPPGRAIHLLRQACGALKEAHRVGLIHRDVKPPNIHVCHRGDIPDFVKVLDFGLVRQLGNEADATKSNVNAVVGTPLYMSPEAIISPDRIDARADLYGLGCVAYFLVTGSPPFSGNTVVEVCAHHLHTPPTAPSQHRPVPEDLERVILSCLAKDRAARPQSAEELFRALEACKDARTWTEADAETWWTALPAAETPNPASAPVSIKEPRRAIVCDLACRFRNQEENAV